MDLLGSSVQNLKDGKLKQKSDGEAWLQCKSMRALWRDHFCMQSMEETEEFVRLAMKASHTMPALRFDNDDFIDDAIAADAQHQFRPTGRFNADNW